MAELIQFIEASKLGIVSHGKRRAASADAALSVEEPIP